MPAAVPPRAGSEAEVETEASWAVAPSKVAAVVAASKVAAAAIRQRKQHRQQQQ